MNNFKYELILKKDVHQKKEENVILSDNNQNVKFIKILDNKVVKRLKLLENIIDNISPLLNNKYKEKIKKLNELSNKLLILSKKKENEKQNLSEISNTLNHQTKIKYLLERIETIVNSNSIKKNNQIKKELIIMLKTINNIKLEQLELYLNNTIKIMSKKINDNTLF